MALTAGGIPPLHALRIKGFADTDVLAAILDQELQSLEAELVGAEAAGLVKRRVGQRPGWALTAKGRAEAETVVAASLDAAGQREAVTGLYRRFRELNPVFLEVCTDWQVLDRGAQLLNQHEDPEYDKAVLQRLEGLDRQMQPICHELGRRLERMSGYGPRFREALGRLLAGDHDWFTGPTIDSYHTIWFELHEDLLATLGRDRQSERLPEPSGSGRQGRNDTESN